MVRYFVLQAQQLAAYAGPSLPPNNDLFRFIWEARAVCYPLRHIILHLIYSHY